MLFVQYMLSGEKVKRLNTFTLLFLSCETWKNQYQHEVESLSFWIQILVFSSVAKKPWKNYLTSLFLYLQKGSTTTSHKILSDIDSNRDQLFDQKLKENNIH